MPLTSISFVIPMYNEADGIENTIKKLTPIARELADDYEIVIADDGSYDGSGEVADRIAKEDLHVKVLHLPENTKFGGALKAGIKKAQKDLIIYTDSDLPIGMDEIKMALSLIAQSDIVTAYSKVKKGDNVKRIIMSKVYNFLIQFLFMTNVKDINSGFKIYKRHVFEGMELISNSPFVDVEIFIKARDKNFIIKQHPVIFKHREKGKSYISRPSVVLATIRDMFKFYFKRWQKD